MMTLELQPIDAPEAAASLPKPPTEIEIVPLGTSRATPLPPAENIDRFLREATHQYAEGHLDQPLWDRAFAQANGDKEAAVESYLHARATALRLLDRERRSGKPAHMTRPVQRKDDEAAEQQTIAADEAPGFGRRRGFARYRNAIIAGAILVPLAVGGWLFNAYWNANLADTNRAAQVSETKRPGAPAASAANRNAIPDSARAPSGASPELLQKIADLRDAGNANVLVLYLVEWTRKEPANPAAWDQLRAGYVTLKQYDDALSAARKAVELAPDDPRMWRNIGAAHRDAGDATAALLAFEQNVARDERDADSFREIGILNAQLSHLPEAGRAFDRALAINPGNAITLCMRSAVAQLSSAPKDSYATTKQVKVIDDKCRGP